MIQPTRVQPRKERGQDEIECKHFLFMPISTEKKACRNCCGPCPLAATDGMRVLVISGRWWHSALPADRFRRRCVQTRQNSLHCHFIRLPSAPLSSIPLTSHLFWSSRAGWQRFCHAATPYAEEPRASFAILQPLEHPARGISSHFGAAAKNKPNAVVFKTPSINPVKTCILPINNVGTTVLEPDVCSV